MQELSAQHARRGNGRDRIGEGDISSRLFGEKEKSLIFLLIELRDPNRSSDRAAKIVIAQHCGLVRLPLEKLTVLREVVIRIEYIVADEFVHAAMQVAGARLGYHVYLAAGCPAILGAVLTTNYLKLTNRVNAGE